MSNQLRNEPATPALIMPTPAHTALETAPPQESELHSVATIQDAADAELARIQKERRDLGTRHFEYEQELMQLREKMTSATLSLEEMEAMQKREGALDQLRKNALLRDEELVRDFVKAGERRLRVDDEREHFKRLAQDLRIAINQSFTAEQDAINRQRIIERERDAAQKELQRLETQVLPQYGDVRITPLQNMPLTDRRS